MRLGVQGDTNLQRALLEEAILTELAVEPSENIYLEDIANRRHCSVHVRRFMLVIRLLQKIFWVLKFKIDFNQT
jgi:hypothetical protein